MIDFPLNLRDGDEDEAWRTGSLWLSLDRFERFWPDVGLTLSNGEAVKAALRDALRIQYAFDAEWRAAYFANPDAPEDHDAPDPTKGLPQTCFRSIVETAGPQDAECVARWLTGPVLGALKEWTDHHHRWHRAWCNLLYHMWELNPDEIESSYGIPGHTVQRIVEIASQFRSEFDANRERVEAADQEPLSGWDAIAYADYRWETAELSPLDTLSLHLRYICFDRAWAEVVRHTRPTDMDALIQWGREYVAAKMSDTTRDDETIIPEDVRAAWSDLHAQPA